MTIYITSLVLSQTSYDKMWHKAVFHLRCRTLFACSVELQRSTDVTVELVAKDAKLRVCELAKGQACSIGSIPRRWRTHAPNKIPSATLARVALCMQLLLICPFKWLDKHRLGQTLSFYSPMYPTQASCQYVLFAHTRN